MKLQRLLSYTRKALDDYKMIDDGDNIAIGLSGGKDSLTLLYALSHLRQFYPKKFNIEAITVSMGYKDMDFSPVEQLCKELGVNYTIVETEIADIVFSRRKETNPCSLCAKLRKGAFNIKAKELGCNKEAYAHHNDDVIETMMMSLLFEGRFNCFSPVTYLDKTGITLIRPLIYVKEADIKGFRNAYNLPVVKNPCPVNGYTKRQYVKDLIKTIQAENPGLKKRLFHAIKTSNIQGWNMSD
ncbi:MAG TPA: tRNA 2-thiocytidine biosynthesis TtcA family protein [Sedimentibacter sp.]|jgi:tRNA(Ile)-lysidine synthase TilS/MesJ|nr:tRNA 2-thiocytidine biosynthesis protein TtcA [Sedimentibacter sp.]HOK49897.1 tRNA 2-thiocytidine biosynthesis TtcA family protein [Sedimentibacter sp.]HOW22350.1 tRNA 2-thiocytidine biosynthesis TtcA family protein [Sedimentibacter sp.]HRC81547.1 tRNA 2-thiocytidine biosynthesis TtcA family protein [Sedimentibacter sp.]